MGDRDRSVAGRDSYRIGSSRIWHCWAAVHEPNFIPHRPGQSGLRFYAVVQGVLFVGNVGAVIGADAFLSQNVRAMFCWQLNHLLTRCIRPNGASS